MSGINPLIDTMLATRLAQRIDLIPLKGQDELAGPGVVNLVEKVTNDVRIPLRTDLQQQLGVPFNKNQGLFTGRAPGPRDGVVLSSIARALMPIFQSQDGQTTAVLGSKPLLTGSTPPIISELTAALSNVVDSSGLFYESHLQEYAAGTRTLAQLVQEPQANLNFLAQDAEILTQEVLATVFDAKRSAPVIPNSFDGALLNDVGAQDLDQPKLFLPLALSNLPVNHTDVYSSALAAAFYTEMSRYSEKQKTPIEFYENSLTKSETVKEGRSTDSQKELIHPSALALVRQQLELLNVPIFRWAGEAWPGASMDWEIQEEPQHGPADQPEESKTSSWSTSLSLTLPSLGTIHVRLNLTSNAISMSVKTGSDSTAAILGANKSQLPVRLGALGLALDGIRLNGVSEAAGSVN